MAKSVPVPFADLGKSTNDLLGKDFPVGHTKLELKTVAPNGVVCLPLVFLCCFEYPDVFLCSMSALC